ncbi:MAG: hypothetical protein HGA31_01170 [Candidatus Moranbacteria bacterium]|nr:hypothetical protein [Candidatus Moranbacteria bacterium]
MESKKALVEELFTDSGPFDEERVVAVLKPLISVQRDEHILVYHREVSLKADEKILAYGLVKKLLQRQGAVQESSITGKEVVIKTGLKSGTVDPTIKKLKAIGLLAGKGNYEIPVHEVDHILKSLESRSNSNKS